MFERESSREKNLEKGAREAKFRARKEAARGAEPIDRVTEEDLAQVGAGGGGEGVEAPPAVGRPGLPLRWRRLEPSPRPLPPQVERDFFSLTAAA